MNKEALTTVFKNIQNGLSKHSPEILTGIGIAGMITTTVLAVKATPKALQMIDDKKKEEHVDKLTPMETVKTAWKPYIPAVVTGTMSTACIIGASRVSLRRNAALATAYQLSSTALADYKEKVVETIGEKKEQGIREKVAQKKVDEKPVESSNIIITGNGQTLCHDPQFGQYFNSNIDAIKAAVTELNYRMIDQGQEYVSLNDFYDELGVERIEVGDELGWNVGRDGKIVVQTSAAICKNNQPCIVIHYNVAPKYDYFKFNR